MLIKIIGKAPAPVKRKISDVLNLGWKGAFDSAWISRVTQHMAKYPLSYTTVVSTLSATAPDLVAEMFEKGSAETIGKLSKLVNVTDYLPGEYITGADGDSDSVWGESVDDFNSSVERMMKAKRVVEEAAFLLGTTPKIAIEISMLLRGIEPQFIKLFEE
jgi:hypothetical protein